MAAGDVVGEDFKLRLVVHRNGVGQKQSLAQHLGVGLLRILLDMILPWKTPVASSSRI